MSIAELAADAANNHAKFSCFGWHDAPENREEWTVVYTHNRDSTLLALSNARAIEELLQPFIEAGDVEPEHHGHFACGWVDGYSIRVYRDGAITPAFSKWVKIQAALEDYPVLNDEDYSAAELEATLENIGNNAPRNVLVDLPEDWAHQVYSWLSDHNQREIESRGDQGGYPSDEAILEALIDLEIVDPRKFVQVYRDNVPFVDGADDCSTISMPLYEMEFTACMQAMENGEDTLTIGSAVYSWTVTHCDIEE